MEMEIMDSHACQQGPKRLSNFWLALTLLIAPLGAQAQIQTNAKSSSPIIVADFSSMTNGPLAGTQMDAPMSTFTVNGQRLWIKSEWNYQAGGIKHSLHQGSLDAPYASLKWSKNSCNRGTNNFCVNGPGTAFTAFNTSDTIDVWFVNAYQANEQGEILAFVHEERVGGSGGVAGNQEGKTRIGLAWSSNGGESWTYLGRILSAHGEPQPHNIQGLPYVTRDGYIYVYFTDTSGIAIARAPIADVIAEARQGNAGAQLWKKYYAGAFTEPGLGGNSSRIAPWGITHSQATYSTHTGKYYMALTFMTWGGRNTNVDLYESHDAINWSPSLSIADETASNSHPVSGYQYCSIADAAGRTNAISGQHIYIYCLKDPGVVPRNFAIYRWKVNLGVSKDTFRQSTDFSSSQGPYWWYQKGSDAGIFDLNWISSYWGSSTDWPRIWRDSMHPAPVEIPVLKWVAPKAGTVRIEGTLRDADITCGDGVNASVVHNGEQIYSTAIDNGDTVGKSLNIVRHVIPGDGIFFMVGARANHFCDSSRWDPSITYE
ncbi:hypothetical protein [Stenotrophomonas maltophilia]|uniref:hypothetical protein n=1 Tax=Stenotrophomonas maltophilia TaxID=40324 RepID=UPI001669157F|nr:hypothetical protein [Stenotrophomonas maltophilia]